MDLSHTLRRGRRLFGREQAVSSPMEHVMPNNGLLDNQTESEKLFKRALEVSPGGVHSPVRAFRGVGGTPVFIKSARGAEISDVDGNSYVDFCMSWGPLIFGHQDPETAEAVQSALGRGWSYG